MLQNATNDAIHQEYADPVSRLLTAGDAAIFDLVEWPNYPEKYALGSEHIPALIRMACDMALHMGDADGTEIWAPVHAWRALAQMRAEEAIQPLLEFTRVDLDDDAVAQEFATVFGMIGPAVIAPIGGFLEDRSIGWLSASLVTDGLKEVVRRYPECRDECVATLTGFLAHASDNDPVANGGAISTLIDLAAVEAIETIRDAFRMDAVDISIAGDLEDVEIDLGLRQRRVTPRPRYHFAPMADRDEGFDPPFATRKIGRNELCPCGSGKKYKKCCLE
jgi:hypothetical protein